MLLCSAIVVQFLLSLGFQPCFFLQMWKNNYPRKLDISQTVCLTLGVLRDVAELPQETWIYFFFFREDWLIPCQYGIARWRWRPQNGSAGSGYESGGGSTNQFVVALLSGASPERPNFREQINPGLPKTGRKDLEDHHPRTDGYVVRITHHLAMKFGHLEGVPQPYP